MATRRSRRAVVSRRRGQSRKCCGRGRPATSTAEWPRRRVDLEMLRRGPPPNWGRPRISALNPPPPPPTHITSKQSEEGHPEKIFPPFGCPKGVPLPHPPALC